MDPDEMEEYLASLPPEMQEQVLYEMGFGQANTMMPSFGGGMPGAFSPELSRGQYDLGMYNRLPPDIEYGEVQPFGLDELSQAYNIMQDQGALTLDPAIAAYAGRGAFDPAAFQPQTIPIGEPLDLAGSRYVSAMAQAGGGYESYLAQKIAGGMTPGGAVADMWAKITAGGAPDAPPEVKAERDALVASLPPNTSTDPGALAPTAINMAGDFSTPEGQAASANVDAITYTANDLFERMVSDQPVGYTDPMTGLGYAGAYQEPSELAAKFAEYGLPTPNESYLDEKWLNAPISEESALARQYKTLAGEGMVNKATGIADQMKSNLEQLTEAWKTSQPERAAAAQTGAEPQRTDFTQPVLSPEANADVMAEWRQAQDAYQAQPQGEPPDLRDFYEGGPLPRFAAAADNAGDYEKAYADWQAESDQGTGAPYVVSSGDKVLGTYDFGEHPELGATPQAREGVAALMGVIGGYGGGGYNPDVSVGQMDQGFLGDYRNNYQDAYTQQLAAQQRAEGLLNYSAPDEMARARSAGLAYAMEQAGRTPLQDMLMQRSMQRTTMMPYTSQMGYMGY